MQVEINPSWEISKTNDVLYFIHSSGKMITINSHIEDFSEIIQKIDKFGSKNISFLCKCTGIQQHIVSSAISILSKNSIIVSYNKRIFENQVSSRQQKIQKPFIHFLQDNSSLINEQQIENKYVNNLNKRITFIGLGATGSLTAQLLVSAGFRNIRLVDGDIVELQNLGRQFIYTDTDIGKLKTKILKDRLLTYDPEISVEIYSKYITNKNTAMEAIQESDFVLLTADKPKLKIQRWIDYACKTHKISYLRTMFNQVGPIFVPGKTPCFNCIEEHWKLKYEEYKIITNAKLLLKQKTLPASPFSVMSAASFYAEEIFKYITGIETPRSLEGIIIFKSNSMEIQKIPFAKKCNCRL